MDDLKFPDFRKKFKIRGDSRFIFFKDGKKFDECMLNRRGAGIIINEMLFVPKK
ncbi:MAG: hypothetical protein US25_C0038G0014 [Candidatus Moranbacteria bacterium GW2011_GWE1_36_7]|nr:MAG: hypothetical protein US25_C0038G0014 [Candidatus Moranbacteria bacterium GW2011_GWE1_36_7]